MSDDTGSSSTLISSPIVEIFHFCTQDCFGDYREVEWL